MTQPDAWTEFCLIGITTEEGSEIQFAGFTEDITAMDWGEKDIEGVPLVNGGRVVKKTPMTDESMTLKIYPVSGELDGTGIVQHMHPQGTNPTTSSTTLPIANDITTPLSVFNTNLRRKHLIILLWADKLPSAASTLPDAGYGAYRIQVINAYVTKYVPSFDDKIMSAEVTFKWTPFAKDNSPNKKEESTTGTQLPTANATVTTWA